jgi:hypothetical protein
MVDTNTTGALTVIPTVTPVTLYPDAEPITVTLGAMTTPDLKAYVTRRVAQERQAVYELTWALRELKSRCKDAKVWQKALLECGIKPATWRQWEFRALNQLTTGKRTGNRKPEVQPTGDLGEAMANATAAKVKVEQLKAATSSVVKGEYMDADSVVPAPVAPATTSPCITVTITDPTMAAVVDCDDKAVSLWALFEQTNIENFMFTMRDCSDFFLTKLGCSSYANGLFFRMWDEIPCDWHEQFLDSDRMTKVWKKNFGSPKIDCEADAKEFTNRYIEFALAFINGDDAL